MPFAYPQKILFKHCDPAGIVFYPRIFEMINDAVEAFFDDVLHWPFEAIHPEAAVPTASFETRFLRPCRHGDRLILELIPGRMGRSSLAITTKATRDGEACFEASQTLVHVDRNGRPAPWPDHARTALARFLEAAE